MTQQNLLELAKQGNPKAIEALINRSLQPKGITAKTALKDGCLQVMLESAEVPDQQALAAFIRKGVTGLGAASIQKVKVYGRQTGEDFPAWSQQFEIITQAVPISHSAIPTPTKTPANLEKNLQTKNTQVEKISSKTAIKQNTKTVTYQIKHGANFISRKPLLLGAILLSFTCLGIVKTIFEPDYRQADCPKFATIIEAAKKADSDAGLYVNNRYFQSAANIFDKSVIEIESIKIKDKKLKAIKKKLITEEKAISASFLDYFRVQQLTLETVKSLASLKQPDVSANDIKTKADNAAENLKQAFSNHNSLINDANNYCKNVASD